MRTPSGAYRWFQVRGQAVWDEHNNAVRMAGSIQDITDRKEAQDVLETQNAELERYAYTVSHDLKTPLVTIKGFLGMLRKDAFTGNVELMEHDIAHIGSAADKMARLLAELLELSRIGRLMNPSLAVALTDLAHEAVQLVTGPIVENGVAVEIDEASPSDGRWLPGTPSPPHPDFPFPEKCFPGWRGRARSRARRKWRARKPPAPRGAWIAFAG